MITSLMRVAAVTRWLVPLGALLLGVAAGAFGRLVLAGDGGPELAIRPEMAPGVPAQAPEALEGSVTDRAP